MAVTEYLARSADRVLSGMLAEHPATFVVGPRATGKTTTCERFARTTIRLGDEREAEAFRADPRAVLRERAEPILIDEWQVVPESLGAIKEAVDSNPRPGRFLITGSVRGDVDSPTWPGTGRLVRLSMYGLTELELEGRAAAPSWITRTLAGDHPETSTTRLDTREYVERALRSGFPEPALRLSGTARQRWLSSYVDQLVTRDAEGVEPGRDPQRVRRYLEALSLNTAGVVEDTTIYEAAHINRLTARAYDRLLQNLLIVDRVPSWTSNRLKRLVLASKRYLIDPGLLAGVLAVDTDDVLRDGDLLGRVLDTFVSAQLRAQAALMMPAPRLHHLRTEQGRHEIDLVIEVGYRRLIAIEIKATAAPNIHDAVHLRWFREQLGDAVIASVLFHTGPYALELAEGIVALPISSLWA